MKRALYCCCVGLVIVKTAWLGSRNKTRHPVIEHSSWVTIWCAMSATIGAVEQFVFKSCLGFTKNCVKGALHLYLGNKNSAFSDRFMTCICHFFRDSPIRNRFMPALVCGHESLKKWQIQVTKRSEKAEFLFNFTYAEYFMYLGNILKGLGRTNGGDQVSCGSSNAKKASIRPRWPLHGWNRPSATRHQPETETLATL